jgi:hypothetical protein
MAGFGAVLLVDVAARRVEHEDTPERFFGCHRQDLAV